MRNISNPLVIMKLSKLIIVILLFSLYSCSKSEKIKNDENIAQTDLHGAVYNDENIAQTDLYGAVHKGDIKYIKNFIEEGYSNEYEERFSNADLRLLRNTIYAMHGYIFKSNDLLEHFQKFAWYKGTKETVSEDELTKKESRLIRVLTAMEAANPPTRNDLIGHWVCPVAASVENIGFLDLYLEQDGSMSDFANGYWSWDGVTFRTVPDSDETLFFSWKYGDKKNLRIIIFEHNGELYKATSFFDDESGYIRQYKDWYQADKMPSLKSGYWGNWDNTIDQ